MASPSGSANGLQGRSQPLGNGQASRDQPLGLPPTQGKHRTKRRQSTDRAPRQVASGRARGAAVPRGQPCRCTPGLLAAQERPGGGTPAQAAARVPGRSGSAGSLRAKKAWLGWRRPTHPPHRETRGNSLGKGEAPDGLCAPPQCRGESGGAATATGGPGSGQLGQPARRLRPGTPSSAASPPGPTRLRSPQAASSPRLVFSITFSSHRTNRERAENRPVRPEAQQVCPTRPLAPPGALSCCPGVDPPALRGSPERGGPGDVERGVGRRVRSERWERDAGMSASRNPSAGNLCWRQSARLLPSAPGPRGW